MSDFPVLRRVPGKAHSQTFNPGDYLLGSPMDYPNSGKVTTGEVQYSQIWLQANTVIGHMKLFCDGSPSGHVNLGIYSQATPTSPTGVPNTRVAQTGAITLTSGDANVFKTVSLTGSYTVPTSGYYWIAFITDSATNKYAMSNTFRQGFASVWRETSTGTTLPATSGVLSNPVSAVIYAAAAV